jgi:nicotinamide-nucleotide amidase
MKKNILLIVGSALIENRPYYHYILRQISQALNPIDEIIQINSNKLLLTLENTLSKDVSMVIVTTNNNFTTVSKVIATVLGDTLELKSNMLLPTKTKFYEEDSFVVDTDASTINVVKAAPLKKFPPVLIQTQSSMVLHLFELDQESIEVLIEPLTKSFEIDLSYSDLTKNWVQIHCKNKKHGEINHFISSAKKLFLGKVIDSKNIFKYIINTLAKNEKTITFAESCTGGLIASKFTAQSGASAVIKGSSVTYSNEIKHEWLGVDNEVFETFGAVSKECVEQMCTGALDIAKADFSIAVSGIAGPTGATEYKPVGTVVIGVAVKNEANVSVTVKEFHFEGDRNYVQDQTLYCALEMLLLSDKSLFF